MKSRDTWKLRYHGRARRGEYTAAVTRTFSAFKGRYAAGEIHWRALLLFASASLTFVTTESPGKHRSARSSTWWANNEHSPGWLAPLEYAPDASG